MRAALHSLYDWKADGRRKLPYEEFLENCDADRPVRVALCGVTAMAEADRFQFEKTNLTVFEGNTLELSLIRQGNCAADGELTFVSGRENIATVDENGVVTGLTKGQSTITATLKTEKRTWKASVTVTVARAVTDIAVNETSLTLYDAADPLISHLTGGAGGRVLLLRKGKQVSIRATLSPMTRTTAVIPSLRRIRTWCA